MSPETKDSKEDDIICIWEKGQMQLLLMLQDFDSEGKHAFFFSYLARYQLFQVTLTSQKGSGTEKSTRDDEKTITQTKNPKEE